MNGKLPPAQRFLLTAAGILLGAYLVYLGVSISAPEDPAVLSSAAPPPADSLVFRSWSAAAFEEAQHDQHLVFLLIADSRLEESVALTERMIAQPQVRTWLIRRFVPILIDRRVRPDIAERYSEGRAPFVSVLLPTGEALTTLDGPPADWPEELAETYSYWRDHREEIQSRVEEFWLEAEARAVQPRTPRPPSEADIGLVEVAALQHVDSVLKLADPGPTIWRSDLWQFLFRKSRDRNTPGHEAGTALLRLAAARLDRWPLDPDRWVRVHGAVPLVQLTLDRVDTPDLSARRTELQHSVQNWLADHAETLTAEAQALWRRLTDDEGQEPQVSYPMVTGSQHDDTLCILPHTRHDPAPLCFYLTDVLSWLETMLATGRGDSADIATADPLAERAWARLWSERAQAFRDKAPAATAVREIEVFPRAQLGRMARICWRLGRHTGDDIWQQRGDSCLSAFAPYAEDAGIAACFYALALLEAPWRKNLAD